MFGRFTHDVRAVVIAAVAEAEHRDDRRVGTEHLPLDAVASPNAVTAVTDAQARDAAAVRAELERRMAAAA